MFKKLKNKKGQAMVEFALILPVLMLVLCGIMDFGWLYFNQLSLNNAAREGARYAAVHYTTTSTAWQTQALAVMSNAASGVNSPDVQVVKNPTSPDVTATASAEVPVLTGFTSAIIGNTKSLSASCTMKIEF